MQFAPTSVSSVGNKFQTRLKFWAVTGLLTANLAVGVVSLYFLRAVNQRYAIQFETSMPVLNSLHTLSRELTGVQRLARQISDAEIENAGNDLLIRMDETSDNLKAHALILSRRDLIKDTAHATALVAISREYEDKTDRLRILAREPNLAEARRFNLTALRPCYDRYQLVLDAAIKQLEQQDTGLRDRYAKDSRYFGGLALAFTGWPVLLAVLAMITLGVLVLTLLFAVFTPDQSRIKSARPSA